MGPTQAGAPPPSMNTSQPGSQPSYGAPQPPYGGPSPSYGAGGQMPSQMGGMPGQPMPQMGSQPGYQMGGMPGQMGMPPQTGSQMGSQMGGMPGQMGMPPQTGSQMGGMPGQMGMSRPTGQAGSISLAKGGNVSLTKTVPGLRQVRVGLGWDARSTPGAPFDLDASVWLVNAEGRCTNPQNFIFYNNRQSMDGSILHHGDNLTGVGEGDDEQISIDLTRVSPDVAKIVFCVSIYEAEQRMQNFGMVSRAFIRVVNSENSSEIVRFDLTEDYSMSNCVIFGEVYRYGNEWKFRAVGQGIQGGMRALGQTFGINLA
jgi:tellurium resistance protein TerD